MPQVGLKFDLDAWRQGVRRAGDLVKKGINADTLRPFERGLKAMASRLKKTFASINQGFAGFGRTLAGFGRRLMSLPALLLGAAGVAGFAGAISKSIGNVRELYDAQVSLNQALEVGAERFGTLYGVGAAREIEQTAAALGTALGFTRAELTRVAAEFAAQGFGQDQVEGLTALAANVSRVTGKNITEITKKIAEASMGQVEGLKELGVFVNRSGNAITDAEAGLSALAQRYGTLGEAIKNPSDQLRASVEELWARLGEGILPAFDRLIVYVNEFVQGLLASPEILESIGEWVSWGIDQLISVPKYIEGGFNVLSGGLQSAWGLANQLWNDLLGSFYSTAGGFFEWIEGVIVKLVQMVLEQIASVVESVPGLEKILGVSGEDIRGLGTSLEGMFEESGVGKMASDLGAAFRENAASYQDSIMDGLRQSEKGWSQIAEASMGDQSGSWFEEIAARGREAMEQARQDAKGIMGNFDPSASPAAMAAQRQAAAAERQKAIAAQGNRSFGGSGSVGDGSMVQVRIMSQRGDRFRRARSR